MALDENQTYQVTDALQWGHGREAMDGLDGARRQDGIVLLQWGHGREAMDGSHPAQALPQAFASMGPRP